MWGLRDSGLPQFSKSPADQIQDPEREDNIIVFVVLRHLPQWRIRVGGGGGQAKVLVLNSLLGIETT